MKKGIRRFFSSLKFIWRHPLIKGERVKAFVRYFTFHITTRINNENKIIPFIEGTKINICRDMNGTSTNYFTYLSDFEEMLFLLHFLRSGDVFYDIGSNVGTYTILAAGVVGCHTIAIEPVRETYDKLLKNLDLNRINNKVSAYNIALGEHEELVNISNKKGALNRIISSKNEGVEMVKQKLLDDINIKENPRLLKIDVEGYEMKVIQGGKKTLSNPELQSVIIELNGNSRKYGFSDNQIHKEIISYGFNPICYDPLNRYLTQLNNYNTQFQNTIYIRDIDVAKNLVLKSKKYKIGIKNI